MLRQRGGHFCSEGWKCREGGHETERLWKGVKGKKRMNNDDKEVPKTQEEAVVVWF